MERHVREVKSARGGECRYARSTKRMGVQAGKNRMAMLL
jgi:hypothetical protein